MTETTYSGRGLHSDKWRQWFDKGGDLHGLLQEVNRKDSNLVLMIRNNYCNIYYKGGNILKVNSNNSFDYNSGYHRPTIPDEDERKRVRRERLDRLKQTRNFSAFISEMKQTMEEYWRWLPKALEEKCVQHSLCVCNNESSEYTVIDVEFEVSKLCPYHFVGTESTHYSKTTPRFDIIAIRNADRRLCVIELKKGGNALFGKSGIADHYESFQHSIGRNPKAFLNEIRQIVENRKALGLLSPTFSISDKTPEFLFAYACTPEERGLFEHRQKVELGGRKCRAIFLNVGEELDHNDYILRDNATTTVKYKNFDQPVIVIRRGIDMIGGCITEIRSKNGDKILIDLGHKLPEGDEPALDELDDKRNLESLLNGVQAVFYTHPHGDHLGFATEVANHKPLITQYIGGISRELMLVLNKHLSYKGIVKAHDEQMALEGFYTYSAFTPVCVGDITVTPYPVSHSAPDAYMFVIDVDGKRILHTGDFRDHGYRYNASQLAAMIDRITAEKPVDVLITEGTTLNRSSSRMLPEEEIADKLLALMQQSDERAKYLFAYCSSMDADRIASFYHATQKYHKNRPFIVDNYQYHILKTMSQTLGMGENGNLYRFDDVMYYCDSLKQRIFKNMSEHGATILVHNNGFWRKNLDELLSHTTPANTCLVYSSYHGYIDPAHKAAQQRTIDFINRYKDRWRLEDEYLHTSGHASREALASMCINVNPQTAVIPIHREAGSDFRSLNIPQYLKDRVTTASRQVDGITIIVK